MYRDGPLFVRDASFGIIALIRKEGEWRTFLVCHLAGHWGFPKGHADGEEPHQAAAERELFEETKLQVARYLPLPSLQERYCFMHEGRRIDKVVTYFLAEVKGEAVIDKSELLEGRWVALNKAEGLLTYPEGKALCREVVQSLMMMEHAL